MTKLTPRLMAAVSYVRRGSLVADIGTDHAYLPIYLCEEGILTPRPAADRNLCAVAADINQGPVDRAALHIAMARLSDKIITVRTDGLCGLDTYAPDDIIIFGMGGELIASILDAAPHIRRPDVRLILQPMTHPEKLREYLETTDFVITGETLVTEGTRIYQIICADHMSDADRPVTTPAERLTGTLYPPDQRSLHRRLIENYIHTVTACRDARFRAGQPTEDEDCLLASLARQLERIPS